MPSSKTHLNSCRLMQKVRNSDRKAFRQLYDSLWQSLYARAFTILRDRQLSEDILQEVWIDLWQRRKQIENGNIEAYLFKAVRFKAYNQFRNSSNRREILESLLAIREGAHNNNVEEYLYLTDTKEVLLRCIETLPPKCRKVFELSRFEGLKNKEISQQLSISQSTVENHISNALKVLKAETALHGTGFLLALICW